MAQRENQENTEDKTDRLALQRAWEYVLSTYRNEDEPNAYKDMILRSFKLLFYIVLVLVLIVGVVVTRGSLQILASQLGNHSRRFQHRTVTQDVISYMFFFIIAAPDLFKLLQNVGQFAFGKRDLPDPKRFLMVMVREGFHMFGLGCLLFRVMPDLDPLQTCILTIAITCLPSFGIVFKFLLHKRHGVKEKIMAILSCIFILPSLIGILLSTALSNEKSNAIQKKENITLWTLAAVCMMSTRWIDTYVFQKNKEQEQPKDYTKLVNQTENDEQNEQNEPSNKKDTEEIGHVTLHICSSFLRLLLLIVLFPTVFCYDVRGINETYELYKNMTSITGIVPLNCTEISKLTNVSSIIDNSTVVCSEEEISYWFVFVPFLVHNAGGYFTTHLGVLACRLKMQKFGFAIPLVLATPLYVIILILISESSLNFANDLLVLRSDQKWILIVIFVPGWAGQFLICPSVFENCKERIEHPRRLFVLPHYCSALVDLALIHSRRKHSLNGSESTSNPKNYTVYICATMWHESKLEMEKLLMSLYRLYTSNETRHFEFEVHIIFDDALKDGSKSENEFVQQFKTSLKDIFKDRFKGDLKSRETPYGKQMEWVIKEKDKLFVHLKDKDKVPQKKRWSQIMYMFYIVEFVIYMGKGNLTCTSTDEGGGGSKDEGANENNTENKTEADKNPCSSSSTDEKLTPIQEIKVANNTENKTEADKNPCSSSSTDKKPTPIQKIKGAMQNNFILALDGDVDFRPEALHLLLDRMKLNKKIGANCGRIIPGGSGPVVWYQRFEYAIGHWLQKTAEHMFGCVLCSPGCFSLFRVEALCDVMPIYASESTNAREVLQYDQGEDRWLCTLLLQQGYKIEYCAAAEAMTYAPEGFFEFCNQRRRWIPSTLANMTDLLLNYKKTIKENRYISRLYIWYLAVLFISTLLGPSTVLLALESAITSVFRIAHWLSYFLTFAPTILFITICLKAKADTQLKWAMVLSAIYALLMITVFVGTLVSVANEGWYTPSGVFFYILAGTFIITGLLHPYGFGDLLCGFFYFICIPAGYLFLVIYAICNLHIISWGTRENKATLGHTVQNNETSSKERGKHSNDKLADTDENIYWKKLIEERLTISGKNETQKKKKIEMMTKLRNKVAFMFFFLNVLWLAFMIVMNEAKYIINVKIPTGPPMLIEPLGFSFLVVFTILLALQFIAMLFHRHETMLHILSITKLQFPWLTSKILYLWSKIKQICPKIPRAEKRNADKETFF